MATLLEAVGDYLVANSFGVLGTNLFLAVMPDKPDDMTCVYEATGNIPQFTFGADPWAIDRPLIQVTCRAPRGDYPVARDRAELIRVLLGKVANQTLSGLHVLRISPQGSVNPIGEDDNQRPVVTVNFECMVRYA
jgi:hypothetical protein